MEMKLEDLNDTETLMAAVQKKPVGITIDGELKLVVMLAEDYARLRRLGDPRSFVTPAIPDDMIEAIIGGQTEKG